MVWAELVLEYVKALAWPLVVGGAVLAFRRQIAAKIGDLKDATTPVGGASFFDREAKAVEEKAERAAERQEEAEQAAPPPTPEGPASGVETPAVPDPEAEEGARRRAALERATQRQLEKRETFVDLTTAWGQLNALPDFDVARGIAKDSPRASVMLAYADLEKVARAVWTVARMGPPGRESAVQIIRNLSESGGLDPDFAMVARNLATLRAKVTHGDPEASDVSVAGALDFIGACEQLVQALARNALSKLRHPSRSNTVREWLEWAERERLTSPEDRDEQDDDPAA